MELLERQLYAILQGHHGRTHAIKVSELQFMVEASTRTIRATIAQLVITHRIPIASTVHPPYGFYLITDETEARDCLYQYWSRVRELRRRARILNEVVHERFGINVHQELRCDDTAEG